MSYIETFWWKLHHWMYLNRNIQLLLHQYKLQKTTFKTKLCRHEVSYFGFASKLTPLVLVHISNSGKNAPLEVLKLLQLKYDYKIFLHFHAWNWIRTQIDIFQALLQIPFAFLNYTKIQISFQLISYFTNHLYLENYILIYKHKV